MWSTRIAAQVVRALLAAALLAIPQRGNAQVPQRTLKRATGAAAYPAGPPRLRLARQLRMRSLRVVANTLIAPTATVTESEPNGTTTQADLVTLGDTAAGTINPAGDIDFYAADLTADTIVALEPAGQRPTPCHGGGRKGAAMNAMRWTGIGVTLAVLLAGAACGDNDSTGPKAGTATVSLVTPNADDGVVLLTLTGPGLANLQSASSSYEVLAGRVAERGAGDRGGESRVGGGAHRVGGRRGERRAVCGTVEEAASRADVVQGSTTGYGVTFRAR